jgi:hypothetical protein
MVRLHYEEDIRFTVHYFYTERVLEVTILPVLERKLVVWIFQFGSMQISKSRTREWAESAINKIFEPDPYYHQQNLNIRDITG